MTTGYFQQCFSTGKKWVIGGLWIKINSFKCSKMMDGNKQRVYQISSANQFIISFTYLHLFEFFTLKMVDLFLD